MSPFVEGVRDLLPAEIRERRWVYQELRKVFDGAGYQEVQTPTLESLELYTGTEIQYMREQMFKVVDERGQILVLRPDLTMPITRLAATQYIKTPKPWKFAYISTAYGSSLGQSYAMKEKTQAGVEMFGRRDKFAEVEVISLMIQALQSVGVANPQIDLGQTALVAEVLNSLGLTPEEQGELRILLEEKNSVEIERWLGSSEVSAEVARVLLRFPLLFGEPEEVLQGLRELFLEPGILQVVDEMEQIYQALQEIGYGQYITFDPAMVTQLGYYTGTIFRAYVQGYGEVVASGGRYDGLARQFGLDVPAVGFAVEIERLLAAFKRKPSSSSLPRRILLKVQEGEFGRSYQLVKCLIQQGLQVELYQGDECTEYRKFHQIPYQAWWEGNQLVVQLDGEMLQDSDMYQLSVGDADAVHTVSESGTPCAGTHGGLIDENFTRLCQDTSGEQQVKALQQLCRGTLEEIAAQVVSFCKEGLGK